MFISLFAKLATQPASHSALSLSASPSSPDSSGDPGRRNEIIQLGAPADKRRPISPIRNLNNFCGIVFYLLHRSPNFFLVVVIFYEYSWCVCVNSAPPLLRSVRFRLSAYHLFRHYRIGALSDNFLFRVNIRVTPGVDEITF